MYNFFHNILKHFFHKIKIWDLYLSLDDYAFLKVVHVLRMY